MATRSIGPRPAIHFNHRPIHETKVKVKLFTLPTHSCDFVFIDVIALKYFPRIVLKLNTALYILWFVTPAPFSSKQTNQGICLTTRLIWKRNKFAISRYRGDEAKTYYRERNIRYRFCSVEKLNYHGNELNII